MVCHGDFHPDNIILSQRGPVIIDWPTAGSGEPAADVARTLLLFAIGMPAETPAPTRILIALARGYFSRRYRARYLGSSGLTFPDVKAWLPVIAAARLAEEIDGETDYLVALTKTETGL